MENTSEKKMVPILEAVEALSDGDGNVDMVGLNSTIDALGAAFSPTKLEAMLQELRYSLADAKTVIEIMEEEMTDMRNNSERLAFRIADLKAELGAARSKYVYLEMEMGDALSELEDCKAKCEAYERAAAKRNKAQVAGCR
jgi:chromosome segregation ATPase